MSLPSSVQIVEVGPRDGLQNEAKPISVEAKLAFIEGLVEAGLSAIEVTSFVRPDRVPQLSDAEAVVAGLPEAPNVTFSALVPNMKGLERALDAGVSRIAVFTAASETFAQHNIELSIVESLEVFARVTERALAEGVTVRGYISTCFVCPYEGEIAKERVREISQALLAMGVDKVAISDTTGAAAPTDIERTVGHVLEEIAAERIALHVHDTYGTGLANAAAGLRLGISTFDTSAGGLGGCPYAPGAAGNVATEDLVYMLDRMGIETGVDLARLFRTTRRLAAVVGRHMPSAQYQRMRGMGADDEAP